MQTLGQRQVINTRYLDAVLVEEVAIVFARKVRQVGNFLSWNHCHTQDVIVMTATREQNIP